MSRDVDVEKLALLVAELVDEFTTSERHEWRPSRDNPEYADRSKKLPKPERRVHKTAETGLLEQLRRGTGRRRAVPKPAVEFTEVPRPIAGPSLPGEPWPVLVAMPVHVPTTADAFALIADMAPTPGLAGSGGGGHSKPTSKPPAGLHTMEALVDITGAIAHARARLRMAAGMGRGASVSGPVMLREFLDLALRQDAGGEWLVPDRQVRRLVGEARSWAMSAKLALQYDAPVVVLRDKHCAECGGQMRVRQDASSDVWCAGIPGRVREGPAVDETDRWPMPDRGCGARWPRLMWIDLLDDTVDATEAG